MEYMCLTSMTQNLLHALRYRKSALLVIDEAHMYRGFSVSEVALLIRRLMRKLGISREGERESISGLAIYDIARLFYNAQVIFFR